MNFSLCPFIDDSKLPARTVVLHHFICNPCMNISRNWEGLVGQGEGDSCKTGVMGKAARNYFGPVMADRRHVIKSRYGVRAPPPRRRRRDAATPVVALRYGAMRIRLYLYISSGYILVFKSCISDLKTSEWKD